MWFGLVSRYGQNLNLLVDWIGYGHSCGIVPLESMLSGAFSAKLAADPLVVLLYPQEVCCLVLLV
jgi:hypothetical protein